MRMVYNINGQGMGINFDKVLCFYIDGDIDTYRGLSERYLNIIIGDKSYEPNKLKFIYSCFLLTKQDNNGRAGYEEKIFPELEKLHKDLIKYFKI